MEQNFPDNAPTVGSGPGPGARPQRRPAVGTLPELPSNNMVWMPAVSAAGIWILALMIWLFIFRKPWPFKVLKRSGIHRSAPLPRGDALEERKRDFARIVAPSSRPGLYVVTPSVATPWPYTCKAHGAAGDVNKEVADAVYAEFCEWLKNEAKDNMTDGLAERCVALIAVSEGFTFAMQNQFPPMFPHSRFVLVMGLKGEVRVAWMAFATDKPAPNLNSTPFILKLVTHDLNNSRVACEAGTTGVHMDYVVVNTSEKDLDTYLERHQAAALSRAALEGKWEDVLGTK